jgi:hypothetical protein
MKEAAVKAYKAGTEANEAWAEADEAGAETWAKTAAKAGVEAPEPAAMKSAAEATAVNHDGRRRRR